VSDKQGRHEPLTWDPHRLETLRAHLKGSVLLPGDEGYASARQTWDAKTLDQHPAMIVLPVIASDVPTALTFAREQDLPLAVQAGGHGHLYPADDALLVNFVNMTTVHIDAEAARARVEPGVLFRALVQATHTSGLAPLNGFAATVGIVGSLLGGGCGWLPRKSGAGAASIRSVELVTAEGDLLQVNVSTHPDLFWGLRGGGGNFGVVTALEGVLYPVNAIFAGQMVSPSEQGKGVLNAYLKWTETLPDELTSVLRIIHFPTSSDLPPPLRGTSAIIIMACSNGEAAEGEALLSPMRSLGTALLDTFALIPTSQVATIANDPDEAPPLFLYHESGTVQTFASDDSETLLGIAGNRGSGISMVEIRQLGGALARQPEDAMAFTCRQAHFSLNVQATAPSPDQLKGGKQAIATMMQALQPALTGETLINVLDAGNVGPDLTRAASSPETSQRLRALKERDDANNVFRFNHTLPPSS
jgi:hypothetical protein